MSSVRSVPPKLQQLRMLDIAMLATVAALAASTLHEMFEPGALRADRVVINVASAALIWMLVYVADLLMFPNTIMTRFVLTEVAPFALVLATLWTIFIAVSGGLKLQLLPLWVGTFIAYAGVCALFMLPFERRRMRQRRRASSTDPASVGATR